MHWIGIVMGVGLLLVGSGSRAESERTPEETVRQYLTAIKTGKFSDAYDCVSKEMARHKSKEEWAKEQQWIMQMSEAKILDFKVYSGKIEGDRAYVPNRLSSQDKYLNQLGVEEQELYTLIREEGKWKITQQQLVVEKEELGKWFPDERGAE